MDKHLGQTSSIKILKKLKAILGLDKGLELAKVFNVKANTISSWKTRNSIPFTRLIQVCAKYNIDLNEIFYDNYKKTDLNQQYKQVPILYINAHWDYYFKPEFRTIGLPTTDFPRNIDVDIIIQLSIEDSDSQQNQLIYAFCKKTNISSLLPNMKYVIMVKDKGILYSTLININTDLNMLEVYINNDKLIRINAKEVLEVFLCNGIIN